MQLAPNSHVDLKPNLKNVHSQDPNDPNILNNSLQHAVVSNSSMDLLDGNEKQLVHASGSSIQGTSPFGRAGRPPPAFLHSVASDDQSFTTAGRPGPFLHSSSHPH